MLKPRYIEYFGDYYEIIGLGFKTNGDPLYPSEEYLEVVGLRPPYFQIYIPLKLSKEVTDQELIDIIRLLYGY